MARRRRRIHPGEILKTGFLDPAGMSASALANVLAIPPNRLTEIIAGRRAVTADTALRLARYWGTSVEFWTGLQAAYDIAEAQAEHDYSAIPARGAQPMS